MDEPKDGAEFVECCECHETVNKDKAEPVERKGRAVWMCDVCWNEDDSYQDYHYMDGDLVT